MNDCRAVPVARLCVGFSARVLDSLAFPVFAWDENLILLQRGGDLFRAESVKRHGVNSAHNGGGFRVDYPPFGIVGILFVAILCYPINPTNL
jgi:hypothetical protein